MRGWKSSLERQRRSGGAGRGFLSRLAGADRGATLAFTAVAVIVLLGCAALGVDLGMLITGRVQSQRAADTGALAGALRLGALGATHQDVRDEAKAFANRHGVVGIPVAVTDGDIDISGDTVRVRVDHTVPTLFARILGIDDVDVGTVAAAELVPSSGAECPLPIVAVDGYTDSDMDGLYDNGEPYTTCTDPNVPCTGYNLHTSDPNNDIGLLIEVKSSGNNQPTGTVGVKEKSCGAEQSSWFCWLDVVSTTGSGNPNLRDIIDGCVGNFQFSVGTGDNITSSSGSRQSLVQYIENFIRNNDGSHTWNPNVGPHGCVVDAPGSSTCVANSRRIRPFAVVNPTTIGGTGTGANADVVAMTSVFMDHVSDDFNTPNGSGPPGQWNVYLRLLGAAQGGTGTGGAEGSLLQTVRLIE